MDSTLSRKIKCLGFISIVMVVYLHSFNLIYKYGANVYTTNDLVNVFSQNFISNGMTRVAVPLFFSISGFMFFFNMNNKPAFSWFLAKINKRIKTLFVPYIVWSALAILLFYFMQQVYFASDYFTNQPIENYTILQLLNTLLIKPIPYQLWFTRDLMLYACITPLIYYALSKCYAPIFLMLLFICWLFSINFHVISNEGILFFCFGAHLAIQKHTYNTYYRGVKHNRLLLVAWIILLLLLASISTLSTYNLQYLYKLCILVGMSALWYNYELIFQKIEDKLLPFTTLTFFIYASHEPVLTIIKKSLLALFGVGQFQNLFIYFFSPLFALAIAIFMGVFLRRWFNPFYVVLTGGR